MLATGEGIVGGERSQKHQCTSISAFVARVVWVNGHADGVVQGLLTHLQMRLTNWLRRTVSKRQRRPCEKNLAEERRPERSNGSDRTDDEVDNGVKPRTRKRIVCVEVWCTVLKLGRHLRDQEERSPKHAFALRRLFNQRQW